MMDLRNKKIERGMKRLDDTMGTFQEEREKARRCGSRYDESWSYCVQVDTDSRKTVSNLVIIPQGMASDRLLAPSLVNEGHSWLWNEAGTYGKFGDPRRAVLTTPSTRCEGYRLGLNSQDHSREPTNLSFEASEGYSVQIPDKYRISQVENSTSIITNNTQAVGSMVRVVQLNISQSPIDMIDMEILQSFTIFKSTSKEQAKDATRDQAAAGSSPEV